MEREGCVQSLVIYHHLHLQDEAYCAIRAFEVDQMTYRFSYCDFCEGKGTGNMCTRCRRDKKVLRVWSGENNMDPLPIPVELSGMSDAEQMLR